MTYARVGVRLGLVALITAILFAVWSLSRVLALASRPLADRAHHAVLRLWARALARVIGMRVVLHGRAPRPPFLVASNHLSYVDIVAYWTLVEGTFLAKREVAGWPVLGFLARAVGTEFVDRERRADLPRVVERLRARVFDRGGVLVFPEGTSSAGDRVLPFKASVFEVAVASGCPVIPATIHYRTPGDDPPVREAVCWWGDMEFAAHFLKLLALPRFEAHVAFGSEPVLGPDRKALARASQAQVEALLGPLAAVMSP